MRRDSPPSRETGQDVAGTLDARATGGGFPGSDGTAAGHTVPLAPCLTSSGRGVARVADPRGQDPVVAVGYDRIAVDLQNAALAEVCGTLDAEGQMRGNRDHGCLHEAPVPPLWDGRDVAQTLDAVLHKGQTMPEKNRFPAVLHPVAYGGNNQAGPIDVATARNEHCGPHGRLDFESETFIVEPVCVTGTVTHTLKADGFDASEDGTGRGQPIVVHGTQDPCIGEGVAFAIGRNNGGENVLCFSSKDHGADALAGLAPTLRAGGHADSHANAGVPPAVLCFDTTQITSPLNYSNPKPGDPAHPPRAGAHVPAIATEMQVRRLLPVECERLQGFPDNWTLVPVRKKPAADGPRYKACGNSMATKCMAFIGHRIKRYLSLKPFLDMIG